MTPKERIEAQYETIVWANKTFTVEDFFEQFPNVEIHSTYPGNEDTGTWINSSMGTLTAYE